MPMTLLNHDNTGFCVSREWLKLKLKSKFMKRDLKKAITSKQNKIAINRIRAPFIIKSNYFLN